MRPGRAGCIDPGPVHPKANDGTCAATNSTAVVALAAWLALRARSRAGLVWLTVACVAYFGFYRQGCVCPIGATQNVTLAIFDSSYALPVGVLMFFVLPLAFALFAGRSFCSAIARWTLFWMASPMTSWRACLP